MLTAIGLMSGTSLDGIDAAIIRTDGEGDVEVGPAVSVPYSPATRTMVRRATKAALEGRKTASDIEDAAVQVTVAQSAVVEDLLQDSGLSAEEVDVVGFHGQTILHRPPLDEKSIGHTWQIGNGAMMAERLGIPVVDQFRQADMRNCGQGAPLAPIYHQALATAAGLSASGCAVLNLGGVANITFVPGNDPREKLLAFDCGPGNGLIDQWVEQKSGAAMDEGGALAASGSIDEQALRLLFLNPYIKAPAPKSLDRYDFKLGPVEKLSLEDGAATLTAFSAECVSRSVALLPSLPAQWVVCGGGRHNPVLMAALRERLAQPVAAAEDIGWRGDFIEAECFGYLAVRALRDLPISFPSTTGVTRPLKGGTIHRPVGRE